MTTLVDPSRWDVRALAERYATAEPFAHVAIDGFADDSASFELRAAFEEEEAFELEDEIFHVMASSSPPVHAAFVRFREAMASPRVLEAVTRICGRPVSGIEMRGYAYLPGHYLLAHADKDLAGKRCVAYAYYVDASPDLSGGELDLYGCRLEDKEIVETRLLTTLTPRNNRCVLLEVSETSLHRVREVVAGSRLSLAGWFLR